MLLLALLACGSSGCTTRYQERTAPAIPIAQLAQEVNAGKIEHLRIRPLEVIIFRQNGNLARLDAYPKGDLRDALVAAGAQATHLERVTFEIITPDVEAQSLVIILLTLTAPCCGILALTFALGLTLAFRSRYATGESS
ncbi:MAG: hypothetical protein EXR62_13280 [Chloroflexi bacterium]|nr:hypothetical protein [Chloroflexota bacterium]